MRVALGQLDMVWEDKAASWEKFYQMTVRAADEAADVIIFPEMSLTGFSMDINKIGEASDSSPTKEKVSLLAKELKIAIGYGWAALPEQSGCKGTNRFTLIDSDGKQAAEYKKLHPFTYGGESDVIQGGNEIVSVSFLGRCVSLFICYDLRFPEIFQAASKKADIFFVIANWPAIRKNHWETLLRARAIETQTYVVGVNCYGERDNMIYSGDSLAVDSIGNILGEISDREGILVCELDDRAWSLRNKFNTASDRRTKLYYNL